MLSNECVLPEPRIAVLLPDGFEDRGLFMSVLDQIRTTYTTPELVFYTRTLGRRTVFHRYCQRHHLFTSVFTPNEHRDRTACLDAMCDYATHVVLFRAPQDPVLTALHQRCLVEQRPVRWVPALTDAMKSPDEEKR